MRLESPISLTCTFWGCGSTPDYLDKPNTVHTERPELELNPEPFSPFTSELGVTKSKLNMFINVKPNERGREQDYLHRWSQNTSWKRLKPNVFSSSRPHNQAQALSSAVSSCYRLLLTTACISQGSTVNELRHRPRTAERTLIFFF